MGAEERLAAFQKMATEDPENELAHFSLGKIQLELGKSAEAEASLRRALELSPRHSLAHRFLAEALLAQEREDEAVELLAAGVLLAHEKGEFKPRNEMRERLEELGREPPRLPERTQTDENESALSDGKSVRCQRCARILPRLEEPPFPNDLGNEIAEKICQPCWREWVGVSIKVINEYRLDLMRPEAQETYDTHMKEFLGL